MRMLEGGAVTGAQKWDRTPHDENINRWGGKTEGNLWTNDTPRVRRTTTFPRVSATGLRNFNTSLLIVLLNYLEVSHRRGTAANRLIPRTI